MAIKNSILWRTVALITGSFFLLLGIVLGTMYYTSVKAMKQQMLTAAESNLQMIGTYVDMLIDRITYSMYQYTQNDTFKSGDKEAINEFFNSFSKSYSDIDSIMLLDGDEVVAINTPLLILNQTLDTKVYYELSQSNRLTLTTPYYSVPLASQAIALISSITDSQTGRELLLVAEIRPRYFFSSLAAKLSQKETLVVLTSEGESVYLDYTSKLLGEIVNNKGQLDINENLRNQLTNLRTGITEVTIGNKEMMVQRLRYGKVWNLYILADASWFYEALSEMMHIFQWIFVFAGFLLLFISFLISAGVVRPVKQLARQVDRLSPGSSALQLSTERKDEVGYLAVSFNSLLERLQESTREKEKWQREQFDLEYKVLQSQIQPHFLFNIHMCIDSLLEQGDEEKARKMLHSLDSLLRTSTDKIGSVITLQEELEAVKQYARLQQMRMGDPFDISIDGWEPFAAVKVPKLLLQPIVENAVYHGFSDITHRGEIKIQCMEIDGYIHIVVEDNGRGISKEKLEQMTGGSFLPETKQRGMVSIGLANVRQRIANFYGEGCGLYILSRENIGTRVELVIEMK